MPHDDIVLSERFLFCVSISRSLEFTNNNFVPTWLKKQLLQTQDLKLKKEIAEDIVDKTNWYNWFNDEENTKYMQKHYFPNTKKMQIDFFNNSLKGNESILQLGIYDKKKSVF
mgnify:CR=1 FL=1